jgi:DNA-binding protein H-NS
MARTSDLEKMSFAELAEMEARIERLKIEKQDSERITLRKRLTELAKDHGFDIHELLDRRKRGKGTVTPRYRDPNNAGNTWTGRGRMPRWMAAATKGGRASKEDFLI